MGSDSPSEGEARLNENGPRETDGSPSAAPGLAHPALGAALAEIRARIQAERKSRLISMRADVLEAWNIHVPGGASDRYAAAVDDRVARELRERSASWVEIACGVLAAHGLARSEVHAPEIETFLVTQLQSDRNEFSHLLRSETDFSSTEALTTALIECRAMLQQRVQSEIDAERDRRAS